MTDQVITKEIAELEFDRFIDLMDIDIDESTLDDEDKTAFNKQKSRMIKSMMRCALVISEDGEAIYTPWKSGDDRSSPITFHERTGASVMAADGKKKGHDAAKTYAVMADMTKQNAKLFANLKGPDIKTCEAIFALLMD